MKKPYGSLLNSLLCCTLIAGSTPILAVTPPKQPNFSGHWERDFRRSDDWQAKLQARISQIRRALARQANRQSADTPPPAIISNAAKIVDLARFAESITRHSTMQIQQTERGINIKREGDAALACDFASGYQGSFNSVDGSEICVWDAHQLVFNITLPENLIITHRLSLSPNQHLISVATAVSIAGVAPFSLTRVYQYYEPLDSGLNCELTMSRGTVCATKANAN